MWVSYGFTVNLQGSLRICLPQGGCREGGGKCLFHMDFVKCTVCISQRRCIGGGGKCCFHCKFTGFPKDLLTPRGVHRRCWKMWFRCKFTGVAKDLLTPRGGIEEVGENKDSL